MTSNDTTARDGRKIRILKALGAGRNLEYLEFRRDLLEAKLPSLSPDEAIELSNLYAIFRALR